MGKNQDSKKVKEVKNDRDRFFFVFYEQFYQLSKGKFYPYSAKLTILSGVLSEKERKEYCKKVCIRF